MVNFYTSIIESILTSSITIWYAAATERDNNRLQRIIHSAEKVIGCNLPSLQDLYTSRTLRRAGKIVADSSHPGHKLFETLPSGRRLRSFRTKTSRHKNSFFPSAISLINKAREPHCCWSIAPITRKNSLYVKTYLAIKLILVLILILIIKEQIKRKG